MNNLLQDPSFFAAEHAARTSAAVPARQLSWKSGDLSALAEFVMRAFPWRQWSSKSLDELNPLEQRAVVALNWVALQRWFALEPPRELFPRGIYMATKRLTKLMKRAGYRLKRQITTLPAHDLWVFERTP